VKISAFIAGLLFLLPLPPRPHEQYFFGVNGKPVDIVDQAVQMKEVVHKSERKLVITTMKKAEEGWTVVSKEKIRSLSDKEWSIRYQAKSLFSRKFYREYTETAPGRYLFREYTDGYDIRKGETTRKFPLHLEGTQTAYFPDGGISSISQFRNNQLVSNQNWLEDGTPYIDTLFYSAESEPEYEYGPDFFKNYLLQRLSDSEWDLSQIQDEVVIGWVVMENGEMAGVRALQGKSRVLNEYLVQVITGMPGNWEPAMLDGSPVRYFMSIPLNFISRDVNFQEMGFAAGQLYYTRY
jgi:hypothetical protein